MTPENMPSPDDGSAAPPALRPPDFLLPRSDHGAPRRRAGSPDIYVSWGGRIFGPVGIDDVIAGVRTSYFEEDAIFWFEGMDGWRPVHELPDLFHDNTPPLPEAARQHAAPDEGILPRWPSAKTARAPRRKKPRHRKGKSRPSGLAGKLIVLGAVLLAVALTAGLLLLLSRV